MANDHLRLICTACKAHCILYGYLPSGPDFAVEDVRGFVQAHMDECFRDGGGLAGDGVSLGKIQPFEVLTDESYVEAYGLICPKWDPPRRRGLVSQMKDLYVKRDRASLEEAGDAMARRLQDMALPTSTMGQLAAAWWKARGGQP